MMTKCINNIYASLNHDKFIATEWFRVNIVAKFYDSRLNKCILSSTPILVNMDPEQKDCHFADSIFKYISLNKHYFFVIEIFKFH